jgi:beta-N-acetylhexosaminidase
MGRSGLRQVAAVAAVLVCAVTAGCSGSGGAPGATATARPAATASGGTAAAVSDPPTTSTVAAACVAQALGNLSLAQRVGQLFLVGVDGDIAGPELDAAENTYHFGSLLLNVSAAGTAALGARTAVMQSLASQGTGGVKFFIAANQEGGKIQQLTGPGFATMPSAVEQGGWAESTLRQSAADWGTQLRAAGVNLDLAPVMDVVPAGTAASNAPIGALDRQFGSDPAGNGAHGAAFIRGMADAGVATSAKHFPGLGRVAGNTDFAADVVDDVTTADDPALDSFRAAIGAGVPMVMVALATYTRIDSSRLAAFSPVVMRLLRGKFGFGGVIVSDDLGEAQAVRAIPATARAIDFLDAGGDLITSQDLAPARQMAAAVLAKARSSAAFRATVDDAARLVLTAKQAAGLLPC